MYDVVIAGMGLSGLVAAYRLLQRNSSLKILCLDSASRCGGRIYTESNVDLGPAWVFRGVVVVEDLAKELKLALVRQEGDMGGERRFKDGGTSLSNALFDEIKDKVEVRFGEKLVEVEEASGSVQIISSTNASYSCKQLLVSFPPKKASLEVKFKNCPYLSGSLLSQMAAQPIWMSAMGKVALFYDKKHWDPAYFSSKQFGSRGEEIVPAQVYDGGVAKDGLHGVVAFVAIHHTKENSSTKVVADTIARQLEKKGENKFGSYARAEWKLWRTDENINVKNDETFYPSHPDPISGINEDRPGRRIWFSGAEADTRNPGYLEGAVRNGTAMAVRAHDKIQQESSQG